MEAETDGPEQHTSETAETVTGPTGATPANVTTSTEAPVGAGLVGAGPQMLDRRMLRVWQFSWLIAAVVVAAVTLLAGGVLGYFLLGRFLPGIIGSLLVLAVGVGLALGLPAAVYRRWRFELTEDALELRHGLITQVHSAVPYHRVQHVDVARGPVERMLGLSRLVLHTAAATSDAQLPGIAAGQAETLRTVVLARAGVGDAV